MAICNACKLDMKTADGCIVEVIEFPDGTSMRQVPNDAVKCHDCGAGPGKIHHPGCDAERCPRCNGQIISCGCLHADEDDEDDEEEDEE